MYSYKQKDQKKYMSKSRKIITFVTTSIIVACLISGGLYLRNKNSIKKDSPTKSSAVNYTPATPEEKKSANDIKDKIVEKQKNNPSSSTPDGNTGKKVVTPTITNVRGSVNALISGIFEEGGVCTATFTKGSSTLTKSSAGFENVSYTQCAPIDIGAGFLSSGTWNVVITYTSATASGASVPQTVEAP